MLLFLLLAPIPGAKAWQIERNVICKSVGPDNTPVNETKSFLDTDEGIVVWTQVKRDAQENLPWVDEFYAPDGALFLRSEYTLHENNDRFWVTTYIKGWEMAERPGTWSTKRYLENTLILDENFTIAYTRPKLRLVSKSSIENLLFHPGDVITYTFTLQNIGTAPATRVELVVGSITPENGLTLLELTPPDNLPVGAQDSWTAKFRIEKEGTYIIPTFFTNFYGIENSLGENYVYIMGEDFGGDLAGIINYFDRVTITVSPAITSQPWPFPWWIIALVIIPVAVIAAAVGIKERKRRGN